VCFQGIDTHTARQAGFTATKAEDAKCQIMKYTMISNQSNQQFQRCPVKGRAWLQRFDDVTRVAKTDILR